MRVGDPRARILYTNMRPGWGGFTVIIMQVSVQIGLNLTGLELSLAIDYCEMVQVGENSKSTRPDIKESSDQVNI